MYHISNPKVYKCDELVKDNKIFGLFENLKPLSFEYFSQGMRNIVDCRPIVDPEPDREDRRENILEIRYAVEIRLREFPADISLDTFQEVK